MRFSKAAACVAARYVDIVCLIQCQPEGNTFHLPEVLAPSVNGGIGQFQAIAGPCRPLIIERGRIGAWGQTRAPGQMQSLANDSFQSSE
jgi:hypothetical protein